MTHPFIRVYTQDNCPQCTATIRWLTRRGIPHHTQPIDDDTRTAAQAIGITAAPVVILGTAPDALAHGGFNPTALHHMAHELEGTHP